MASNNALFGNPGRSAAAFLNPIPIANALSRNYSNPMSKSDILEQLPNLGRGDRREILERIWEMEEEDLIRGAQLDADEKSLLDREWAEYQTNPKAGSEWKEVESRLRQQIQQ
jgi:hypothetical protein